MIDEISLETHQTMQKLGLKLVDTSVGTFLIDNADGCFYETNSVKELYDLLDELLEFNQKKS